jgi:hypothetical protein
LGDFSLEKLPLRRLEVLWEVIIIIIIIIIIITPPSSSSSPPGQLVLRMWRHRESVMVVRSAAKRDMFSTCT